MTEPSSPQGFEDFWRQLRGQTRFTPAVLRSTAFRAQLQRVVAKTPIAGFRVVGAVTTLKALKKNLDYISRGGELVIEGRDGERLTGKKELHRRAQDWSDDKFNFFERRNRLAYSLVLSMPPGTPREGVFEAGGVFARACLDRSDWLLARHDDAPHPHLHLSVRAQSDDGASVQFGPADLRLMREKFAQTLRDHGVEADDAPRWARGVVDKPLAQGVARMERNHLEGRAPEPRYVDSEIQEAIAIARGEHTAERPWERRIQTTQQQVRDRYLLIADGLEVLGAEDDRKLADQVRRFVAQMPSVLTRRERLVEEVRLLETDRALRRARSRDLGELER